MVDPKIHLLTALFQEVEFAWIRFDPEVLA